MDRWTPRTDWPQDLARPVRVDASGLAGPTKGQARGPFWRRTSAGLYVPASVDASRVEQRILEAAARLPPDGAVTGWAALRVAGGAFFDGLDRDGASHLPIPLALPHACRLSEDVGVVQMRGALRADEIRVVHDIPCTTPARAILDEVRRLGELREAVVVLDMALVAGLITFAEIDALLAERRGARGTPLLREARRLATTRSASPQETRMRLVWRLDAGLPDPCCNWPVADLDGVYLGKPDLICHELGVYGEYDGADHRSRERHRTDVSRESRLTRAGLEGFAVVAGDLDDIPLVVARMNDAVERARANTRPRRWMIQANPRPLWP